MKRFWCNEDVQLHKFAEIIGPHWCFLEQGSPICSDDDDDVDDDDEIRSPRKSYLGKFYIVKARSETGRPCRCSSSQVQHLDSSVVYINPLLFSPSYHSLLWRIQMKQQPVMCDILFSLSIPIPIGRRTYGAYQRLPFIWSTDKYSD
jgi:hypothetical protein